MLQLSAINSAALELLNTLMLLDVLANTRLVGGTALALQLGHRKSVDLDLFGKVDFEDIDKLKSFTAFQSLKTLKSSENINVFVINGIKVDVVNYSYPWIDSLLDIDGIRLAGWKDIAAMKLAAITGRGSKKDFTDIFFLLNHFSLREMLAFYDKKYPDGSEFMVMKSLTYFEDAEEDPMPEMILPVRWEDIKERISGEVVKYFG